MAWGREQTHSDKICAPEFRQKTSPAICWNGHCCQWHLHGRCHFRHLENEARQHTASKSVGPCRTCRDLKDEVRQLRKEIQDLTKEIHDFQSRELEKDEEVNLILTHIEGKRKKKRKNKRNRSPEPEETGELKEDPEAELDELDVMTSVTLGLSPEELNTFRRIKAIYPKDAVNGIIDAAALHGIEITELYETMKAELDAEAKAEVFKTPIKERSSKQQNETPSTTVGCDEEDESEEESEDESEDQADEEDEEGDATPTTSGDEPLPVPPPPPPWRMGGVTEQPRRCKGKGKKGKQTTAASKGKG